MDDINIEEFIYEIENRPAIWNPKCDTYNNRLERKGAWEEICVKFVKGYKSKSASERSFNASLLQKKWRHIRDSYARELSKQRKLKNVSGAKNLRRYMYFNQLQFLSQNYETQNTDSQVQSDSTEDGVTASTSEIKTKKISSNDGESRIMKLIAEKLKDNTAKELSEDGDRYFLLSLLDDFKKIPESYKTDAKYDIIGVIRKYAANKDDNEQSIFYGIQSPVSHKEDPFSASNKIEKLSPNSNLSVNSSSDENTM